MDVPPSDFSELALFAAGPVVLFKWRNDEGWPVEWVSPNVESVFGYTAKQFTSGAISYRECIHKSDVARVEAEVDVAFENNVIELIHEPYRIWRSDGTLRWLQEMTHLRRADGEVTHFVGYVVDITDGLEARQRQHMLELELLHAQKLESLGVLAGGVAHDFNNLLTGILGEASLLSRALGDALPDAAASVRQIETLATRAADLTQQLLAYSGKSRFVVQPLDLSLLLREISQMLKVVISKKAVLALALEEGLPPIMADRTQLQQIAMNLLTNASEALTDEAGLIQVTTTAEELSAERLANIYDAPHLSPGTYVVLEVSDDGCGMSEDVLEKLFEPFFTTKAQGRGLGMSATLGIIRSHKGAMRVDSKPGRGTTFTLLFPASSEQPLPVEDEPSGGRWEGSGLALIVDDEEPVRAVVTRMLRRLGFDTITANDGEEAQRVLDEHADEVRLVLLDMTMPVMGGKEALAELRARYPELPVVMSSGFNEQAALPGRAADDTTYFLQKPYQLPDLERVLRRALGPSATGG